ncbi:hypothetical protein M513_08898, partial [Trichuris suis]
GREPSAGGYLNSLMSDEGTEELCLANTSERESFGRKSFGRQVIWPTVVGPTGRWADSSFGRQVVWPTGRL